jgi:hypothetical protein
MMAKANLEIKGSGSVFIMLNFDKNNKTSPKIDEVLFKF